MVNPSFPLAQAHIEDTGAITIEQTVRAALLKQLWHARQMQLACLKKSKTDGNQVRKEGRRKAAGNIATGASRGFSKGESTWGPPQFWGGGGGHQQVSVREETVCSGVQQGHRHCRWGAVHLQEWVGASVLIGGPAAISILEGQDHIHTVEEALIRNGRPHQVVIQLSQSQSCLQHAKPFITAQT